MLALAGPTTRVFYARSGEGAVPVDWQGFGDELSSFGDSKDIVKDSVNAVTRVLQRLQQSDGQDDTYAAYRRTRDMIRLELNRALRAFVADDEAANRVTTLVFKRVDQRLWKARTRGVDVGFEVLRRNTNSLRVAGQSGTAATLPPCVTPETVTLW